MKLKKKISHKAIALALTASVLAGCASNETAMVTAEDKLDQQWAASEEIPAEEQNNDPLESVNRFIFAFNKTADTFVFRPVAEGYRFIVPEPFRNSIQSFLRNAKTPVTLANNLLQGDLERAEHTFARFMINTLAGFGGLVDVAAQVGKPYQGEDFGQTLGTWGTGEGAYLVLPILGPSSTRDLTGLVADIFMDPLTYIASDDFLLGRTIVGGIDNRERNIETLDELEADSLDFYARIRSVYRQKREHDILNKDDGLPTAAPGLTDMFPDDVEDQQLSSAE